jgi:hypothetical protein
LRVSSRAFAGVHWAELPARKQAVLDAVDAAVAANEALQGRVESAELEAEADQLLHLNITEAEKR